MADGRAERCERCKFWEDVRDGEVGECHRYPPVTLGPPPDHFLGFPSVAPADWCGEFASRPDAPPPGADDPTPLEALGLPARAVNVLRKEDRIYPEPWQPIRTVGELVRRSADELESLNNFGPSCTAKVRRALAARGLALRGEAPPVDTGPHVPAQ